MTGVIATIPRIQFSNALGLPLAGGKLTTYLAGTTTPEPTFQDQALTIANPTTITLDATGSCVLWLNPAKSYKFVVKDASGVTQPGWPVDHINGASNLISLQSTLDQYASLEALDDIEGGAELVSTLQAGPGAVKRSARSKLRERVSVVDFGADPTGALDSTEAFKKAMQYLASKGGGVAGVPLGTYKLTNFDLDREGVIFQGEASGFQYAAVTCGVKLVPGAGAVYVARLKGTRNGVIINASEGSGFRNLQILDPNSGTTEYGLFIDSGGTEVESVQISGFQYGCVLADQANQNKFRNVNIILNTKVGFAVTEYQGAPYLHPNVSGITSISNTTFEMRGCNIRQNGFGMVLRSLVGASISDCVIESNKQAGVYIYRTDVSSVRELRMRNVWMENNYEDYVSSSAVYSIAGNNMMKIGGAPIAWTSAYQAGYQMVIDSQTHYGGGGDTMEFDLCQFNCAGEAQKSILILSGFKITFRRPWITGGDTPNLIRVTSDAEAVHWHDPLAGNNPYALVTSLTDNFGANSGQRGAYFKSGTSFGSGELGGVYPELGVFGGPIHFRNLPANDPRRADVRCLDDYHEQDAFVIPWRAGGAFPFTVSGEKNTSTKIGREVIVKCKGTLTVTAATATPDKFFCDAQLPFQANEAGSLTGNVLIEPLGGGAAVLNNGWSPMKMNAVASVISVFNVFPPLAVGMTFAYEVEMTYATAT